MLLVPKMATKTRTKYYDGSFYAEGEVNVHPNYIKHLDVAKDVKTDNRSDGGQIPNWRQKIRDHVNACTNLNGTYTKVVRWPAEGRVEQKLRTGAPGDGTWYPDTVWYRGYPSPCRVNAATPTGSIQDSDAKQLARKKMFNKVNRMNQSSQGLVSLGELRETLRMLRNPAKSLFDSARQDYLNTVRKMKRSNPRNWAKGLSGAWLEWSFGVKPLVHDLNDVVDAFDRWNSDLARFRPLSSSGTKERHVSQTGPYQWSPTWHNLGFGGYQQQYLHQRYRYRALYVRERSKIEAYPTWRGLQQELGLTLENFVPAVWELMPWSFLVDYFVNVGEILEQSFTDTSALKYCNETILDDQVSETVMSLDPVRTKQLCTGTYKQYVKQVEVSAAYCKIIKRSFARTAGNLLVNNLQLSLPGKPQQWLNMAALAIQANAIEPQRYFSRRKS